MTGVAIAEAAGVSQPRASQVLQQFGAHDAVRATGLGYVGRPARLLELYWQRARPLLVGPELCWYSRRSLTDQAARITELADRLGISVAFSADLAPDLLVPWRHPTQVVIYASEPLELDEIGFVPAEARGDATVIVRRTSDPTLLLPVSPLPATIDDVPIADPVQQWWDLLDLGGEDRREAADRLRHAIVDRALPRA